MRKEDLRNPPKQYRPSPFWSWNERLDTEETRLQVREMDEAGMGGYFMHARGGLQTEYLSREWFDNVDAAVDEGTKRGMWAWGYDENGWPSGFGGGIVNGMGEKYQQKYLRMETTPAPVNGPRTVTNVNINGINHHLYYEVNPFYVDTLDAEVTDAFIRSTHRAYKDTMGATFADMKGFFTDEPQVSRDGIPWSLIMEEEYRHRYGEDLAPLLPGLFIETDGYRRVRYRFWKLVRDLFADNFMKRIHDWCVENGSKLTGHMVLEEWYHSHILSNGCCMPPYEFMDIPGMDHLGRSLASIQAEMQLSSVAEQLGKKQVLSETFALSGWNVSFEDLRNIYEHQMVHGINYLCQHLEGYSLRGIRKRDYPASLFKHQPWWGHYRLFNDMVSRIGMLIAEGENRPDILVLHTIESGWVRMTDRDRNADEECTKLLQTMEALECAQLPYHLGDGRIMQRHGRVKNGKLIVGLQAYSVVIVPPSSCFGESTLLLLEQFKAQGGTLIFSEELPEYTDGVADSRWAKLAADCVIADHNAVAKAIPAALRRITVDYEGDHRQQPLHVSIRRHDGMTMYYLVNPCNVPHDLTVTLKGDSATLFNAFTGEEEAITYDRLGDSLVIRHTLPARGSVIFFLYDDDSKKAATPRTATGRSIAHKLTGEWTITAKDDNALTLDYCDLYFDGVLAGRNVPISDVQEMACALGRRVQTDVVFRFTVAEKTFSRCQLVLETPEIFRITVNGQTVDNTPDGYYFDKAFNTVDIFPLVNKGENEVRLSCAFRQSAVTYENLEKSLRFESEKNKLSYDMEIEAIYIKGDFGVYADAPFEPLERRGLRTAGSFALGAAKDTDTDGALAVQGYPFFAGTMTFCKTVSLTAEEAKNALFTVSRLPSNVTQVRVNGRDAGKLLWQPYSLDIAHLCREGDNHIEVTVTGNLRNLLGPFHLKEGESYAVSPQSFFHNSPVWRHGINPQWTDTYCFVEYGLFF